MEDGDEVVIGYVGWCTIRHDRLGQRRAVAARSRRGGLFRVPPRRPFEVRLEDRRPDGLLDSERVEVRLGKLKQLLRGVAELVERATIGGGAERDEQYLATPLAAPPQVERQDMLLTRLHGLALVLDVFAEQQRSARRGGGGEALWLAAARRVDQRGAALELADVAGRRHADEQRELFDEVALAAAVVLVLGEEAARLVLDFRGVVVHHVEVVVGVRRGDARDQLVAKREKRLADDGPRARVPGVLVLKIGPPGGGVEHGRRERLLARREKCADGSGVEVCERDGSAHCA